MLRRRTAGNGYMQYRCPACGGHHTLRIGLHQWNGSFEKPTFHPSVLHTVCDLDSGIEYRRCRSWIANDTIKYLPDCTHA